MMRCIGGSWDGKDVAPTHPGDQWLRVHDRSALPGVATWESGPPSVAEIKYETYRRYVIACRPAGPGEQPDTIEFWAIEGMSVGEALRRLLRLYRPPLKINQFGEEEAPR